MDMRKFSEINRIRCESRTGFNHPIGSWSLSDWITAAVGEFGEMANIAKKLNRERDGIKGNTKSEQELKHDFADELADAFIYLDLIAQRAGINLEDAVIAKFNKTSEKIGWSGVIRQGNMQGDQL